MTTRDAIEAQLDHLTDRELEEIYRLIEAFVQSKRDTSGGSLMEQLRSIRIDGPEDFSTNLDLYMSGEKRARQDIR